MIVTVTVNPSVDHAIFLDRLKLHDTNRVKRTETDAGGKGVNLARVAAELGVDVIATGFLGGGSGAYVRKVLDQQGVRHDFVELEAETRINFSVEEGSDEPPTTFNEPGPTISPENLEELLERCRNLAPRAKWATIGGSLPPGIPPDFFKTLGNLFHEAGLRVALDADAEALRQGLEARPDFIKPNAKEAERLLGVTIASPDDAIVAARKLRSNLADDAMVVLSMGEDGAVMACQEGLWIGRSPKVDARSTIGSGDSLIGAMLWAIEQGTSLEDSFRWGIAAGAATATTDGSEIARRPVIEKLLRDVVIQQRRDSA